MSNPLTKTDLTKILSALAGKPRKPGSIAEARKAIDLLATRAELTGDAVYACAPSFLAGKTSAEEFLAEIKVVVSAPKTAPKRRPRVAKPKAEPKATKAPAPKTAKAAKVPAAPKPKRKSKKAVCIELMQRDVGASAAEMVALTGWGSMTGFVARLRTQDHMTIRTWTTEDRRRFYQITGEGGTA